MFSTQTTFSLPFDFVKCLFLVCVPNWYKSSTLLVSCQANKIVYDRLHAGCKIKNFNFSITGQFLGIKIQSFQQQFKNITLAFNASVELQVHENAEGSKGMGLLQVCFYLFLPPRFGRHLKMDMAMDGKGDASRLCSPWRCTQITHYFSHPCHCTVHLLKSIVLFD